MKTPLLTKSLLSLTIFISCNQLETKQKTIITIEKPQQIKVKQLDKTDSTITNVFEFSKDTIFACKYSGGLIYSINNGENWNKIESKILFNEITITNNGYLIGLNFWKGIHEADYARLYLSKDFGKTWKTFSMDTKRLFPVSIISSPKQHFRILTFDNKIYQLNGSDLTKDWIYIKKISSSINESIEYPYKIDDYNDHDIKLLVAKNNHVDTLKKLKIFRQVENLVAINNFIYISGSGHDKSSDQEYYACIAILDKQGYLKEFRIPGHYSYLKKTNNNVYIFNDAGLFIAKNDQIKKLY